MGIVGIFSKKPFINNMLRTMPNALRVGTLPTRSGDHGKAPMMLGEIFQDGRSIALPTQVGNIPTQKNEWGAIKGLLYNYLTYLIPTFPTYF